MSEPLDLYRDKRDFERTPEPPPAPLKRRKGEQVFVVHRHEARRLHYDLRIERGGVLCSWAVPKGFSFDSSDKHLAIRTEDHPLEYVDFHGVIPKGEYGAGTMTIWDRGRYELLYVKDGRDPVADGDVKLLLRGRRLRGEWHLVKTKGGPDHWLLFKSRDRYAGKKRDTSLGIDLRTVPEVALPRTIRRMKAAGTAAPFSDPDWLFEAQFAGKRVLAVKKGDEITLRGLRRSVPGVEEGLRELRAEDAVVDGVLVAMDANERPSEELLAARLRGEEEGEVVFYAFDLLYYEDYDLRELPLLDRKAGLRAVLPVSASVLFMDHVMGDGEKLVEAATTAGLPAVVAKLIDAPYVGGASDSWREIPVSGTAAPVAAGPVTEVLEKTHAVRASTNRVRLTNLDKVFWPAEGYTKGDLIAYYEQVADVLVPYLRDRAVHMNRFPDGIEGKSFYQKEAKADQTPDWVQTFDVESSRREGTVPYVVCNDRDTLLFLANYGSIDLHPWMSRIDTPDSPDYAVIDLDPKGAPFGDVVRIAREVGKLLRGIGLRPLVKTSGKTGIHVVIPLVPGFTYEQSLLFCEGVARFVVRDLKDIATVERAIESRGGKVYVDFGQNRKGQTVVPPYSARPVRGATVSAPLSWDELDTDLTPSLFTIKTLPERLDRLGDLFRPLLTDLQDLVPAIAKLEALLKSG